MQDTTTAMPDHEVERTYSVVLIDERGNELDPRRVRLRYSPDEAAVIDPVGRRAFAEAARRAERLERREHHVLPTTVYTAEVVHQSRRDRTVPTVDSRGVPIRQRYRR